MFLSKLAEIQHPTEQQRSAIDASRSGAAPSRGAGPAPIPGATPAQQQPIQPQAQPPPATPLGYNMPPRPSPAVPPMTPMYTSPFTPVAAQPTSSFVTLPPHMTPLRPASQQPSMLGPIGARGMPSREEHERFFALILQCGTDYVQLAQHLGWSAFEVKQYYQLTLLKASWRLHKHVKAITLGDLRNEIPELQPQPSHTEFREFVEQLEKNRAGREAAPAAHVPNGNSKMTTTATGNGFNNTHAVSASESTAYARHYTGAPTTVNPAALVTVQTTVEKTTPMQYVPMTVAPPTPMPLVDDAATAVAAPPTNIDSQDTDSFLNL